MTTGVEITIGVEMITTGVEMMMGRVVGGTAVVGGGGVEAVPCRL